MKFSEAIAALEEGKKIRSPQRKEENYFSKETGFNFDERDLENQWELYEEPEKFLSFLDVQKGMKIGKRFRRKDWDIRRIIYASLDGKILYCSEPLLYAFLEMEDFEATDWMEVN
jgi:hypothetical protein